MQRLESSVSDEQPALAGDVQKLIRVIEAWANERPIIANVVLFGPRLRAGNNQRAPVQIAVRYDDRSMVDGFDDWIEQLRTNFAGLSAALAEKVSVITPDSKAEWARAWRGSELAALSTAKVRLVVEPAPVVPAGTSPDCRPRSSAFSWSWPALALEPLTIGRR